jgi:large subunit ribosomal protein L10
MEFKMNKEKTSKSMRIKPVPESKKKLVEKLAEKMKNHSTILIASTKGLPSSQFQKIKRKLRGKAEIIVAKKSIINRAISSTGRGVLQNLKQEIKSDSALFFSDIDAFELAGLLVDNQSPAKAKAGNIALEDIDIEAGPTDLMPGPAISELGSVGLKIVVEGGKLAIKQGATITKKGQAIEQKVVNVLSKLNILPMKVGFIPLAAYDGKNDVLYTEINVDKKGALEALKTATEKALSFAVHIGYATKETILYFVRKAALEEKAIEKIVEKKNANAGGGQ